MNMSDDREHEEPGLDQQERMGHFVKEAIQASNAGLISTIERLIDGKLDAKQRYDTKCRFDFRRKGNEKQFETNTSIEKHLKSAQKSLKSVPLTDNLDNPSEDRIRRD